MNTNACGEYPGNMVLLLFQIMFDQHTEFQNAL